MITMMTATRQLIVVVLAASQFATGKKVEFESSKGMTVVANEGIDVAQLSSIIFDVKTCGSTVFVVLSNTLNLDTNKNASYYMIAFSDAINIVLINCFRGCGPVAFFPKATVGPCDKTHEHWIAWDPDGSMRTGTGHVVDEDMFMEVPEGNVTDIFYAQVSGAKPTKWTFYQEDDAVKFDSVASDGSTVVELAEDTPAHSKVINITMSPPDANVSLSVMGNASREYFYMDGSMLRTNKKLDFETEFFHNVRLIRGDGVTVTVKVLVRDVNDEWPSVKCGGRVEVAEELPVGTFIHFPCTISDRDANDAYNISITGEDSEYFQVVNGTRIIMARRLDREGEKGRHSLNVTMNVTDQAGHYTPHNLLVHVADRNDNYPVFSNTVYNINVTENGTQDTDVLNITVSDPDAGDNANITVVIHDRDANDCHFTLNSLSLVQEAGNCDYEQSLRRHSFYSLTLMAVDNPASDVRKTAAAIVVITVQPRNEHPPFWNVSHSNVSNNELSTKSSHQDITSDDDDVAGDAASGSGDETRAVPTMAQSTKKTTLDPNTSHTGEISPDANTETMTTRPLHMPTSKQAHVYTTWKTTENHSRKKRALAKTKDSLSGEYTFPVQRIAETAMLGTVVYTLQAKDIDSVEHSNLTYNITTCLSDKQEDVADAFEINAVSGKIQTAVSLDLDVPGNSSASYTLNVSCTDGLYTIYGTMLIEIQQVNEFPPIFEKHIQSARISPNMTPPQLVASFNVTDSDLHSNISLYIVNETNDFSINLINGSWGLHFNSSLAESVIPSQLVVIATDQGTPVMSSSSIVVFGQGICVTPSPVVTSTPTRTRTRSTQAYSTSSGPTTRTSTRVTSPSCLTASTESGQNKEGSDILVLKIMAAVEGVVMLVLFIITTLIFTGRLCGDSNADAKDADADDQGELRDDKEVLKKTLSEPSLHIMDDCTEAMVLQELEPKHDEHGDVKHGDSELKDETKLEPKNKERLSTPGDVDSTGGNSTDDSGRGSTNLGKHTDVEEDNRQ